MLSSEEILSRAAQDGSVDISEWPRVLESLLQRLHDIVHNDFPLPPIPLSSPRPVSAIDPEVVASTPPPPPASIPEAQEEDQDLPDAGEDEPPANSQSSTKENDAPTEIAAPRPPVPAFETNHHPQPTEPPDTIPAEEGTLPPDLLSVYQMCTRELERDFALSPPHTIQRLAELVLHPKKYYRFLPAYLRAVDRVISVSSPMSDFPLPTLSTNLNGGFLTNGDTNHGSTTAERDGLGSDESLGGALLTPIPWLRNSNNPLTVNSGSSRHDGELHSESTETIEGPNGAGSIETVSVTVNGVPSISVPQSCSTPASPTLSEQSDASTSSSESAEAQLRKEGGVTQGELLRQEQEAGVVPVNQMVPRRALISGGAAAAGRNSTATLESASQPAADDNAVEEKPAEDTPHARGPERIGMEDMGPQRNALGASGDLDMEAAAGRAKSPQPPQVGLPPPAAALQQQQAHDPAISQEAEEIADKASEDDSGRPGKDPQDVMQEVDKLKETLDDAEQEDVKDVDGDIVVADADGRPVEEKEEQGTTGDSRGPDATDTTAL